MYWKSAVHCERLFSAAGYIFNKTRSSLEANNVKYARVLAWLVIHQHFSEKTLVLFTIFH